MIQELHVIYVGKKGPGRPRVTVTVDVLGITLQVSHAYERLDPQDARDLIKALQKALKKKVVDTQPQRG